MPSTVRDADFYKEQYLRRVYRDGYPATAELMAELNKGTRNDLNLQGTERHFASKVFSNFLVSIKCNALPRSMVNSPDLKNMFVEVVADYEKKRKTVGLSVGQGTPDQRRSLSLAKTSCGVIPLLPLSAAVKDEEEEDADMVNDSVEEQMMEKERKINNLEKEVAEKKEVILQLEKNNLDMAKALMAREDEIQQLEEERDGLWLEELKEMNRKITRMGKKIEEMERMAHLKDAEVARLEDQLQKYWVKTNPTEAVDKELAKQETQSKHPRRRRAEFQRQYYKVFDTLRFLIKKPSPPELLRMSSFGVVSPCRCDHRETNYSH